MSNPNRTIYTGPPLSGPGIMWVNSVPKLPLSEGTFNEWYEKIHIPDIIKAKPSPEGCIAAWRFKSRDPSRARPYLALYAVPDMAFIQSSEFGRVSQYHELLPDGGPSQKFVDFDTRFYRRVQVLQKPEVERRGIGRVIKSTAIQPGPGMDCEFDRWYREEHLEQVSHMSGWRKSTRFELIFKVQSNDDLKREEAPKYLAIHEFEEGTEVKRMPKEEWTDWTKKMVESAEKIDEGTFDYLWGMGDEAGEL
ncbi:hypothetical protein K505DRAFT_314477 [Melanomma pulvis-pyrius CBS 109.77]|uniref:Uncharacterized protein n=1 Tax=Melanomma pulvis-pyrius CBS 109.77 TaxID=1314802 RepID=A0A6A6WXM5_9PLEO|nr:hypothetical protein K505DRAFT_314477 [Melanomma pulvis-pyrius CBS 109.77]